MSIPDARGPATALFQPLPRYTEYSFIPWEDGNHGGNSTNGGAPPTIPSSRPAYPLPQSIVIPTDQNAGPCNLPCCAERNNIISQQSLSSSSEQQHINQNNNFETNPPATSAQGIPVYYSAYPLPSPSYAVDPASYMAYANANCPPQAQSIRDWQDNRTMFRANNSTQRLPHSGALHSTLKVAPAIQKRHTKGSTIEKDCKLIKELSDNLSGIPGLDAVRWESILQNTRDSDANEKETQRRVKEAEALGTRLFGGDIHKLLTSILNSHLDFLVKYVGGTLSTSKKGNKKVRDQLLKALSESQEKALKLQEEKSS